MTCRMPITGPVSRSRPGPRSRRSPKGEAGLRPERGIAQRSRVEGFTLLEVMVVVVILGILATVLVTQITGRIGIAQREATKAQIKQIESAVEEFKLLGRRYPENLEELLRKPSDFRGTWPEGGFLRGGDAALMDPWGKEFVYRKNPSGSERRIEIISYGEDGQEGGTDEGEDIKNWEDKKNK